jgi:hypothetical protein
MVRKRTIWLVGSVTFAILVLFMACGAGGLAMRQGMLPPVQVTMNLGAFSVLTAETDDANCWRPIRGTAGPSCSSGSIYNPNRYYIIWFQRNSHERMKLRERYQKLVVIRLPTR